MEQGPSPELNVANCCTYTLLREHNGETVLYKDGRQVYCHKLAPLITGTSLQPGASHLLRLPCGLDCGRSMLISDTLPSGPDGKEVVQYSYVQTCEIERVEFPLANLQPNKQGKGPEGGTLLKM